MPLVTVIPDIHGYRSALEAMLKASGLLGADDAWVGPPGATLLQLGDLIDRGPASRACVERMMGLVAKHPERVRVLRGNHEEMVLSEDREMNRTWLFNGGKETMSDYGKEFEALCRGNGAHAEWFRNLPVKWIQDDVLFCHAGLHPSDPEGNFVRGLLWARPPIIRGKFRATVSGHTRTRSRKVEMEDQIFKCDIGLGDPGEGQGLEMLRIDTKTLEWSVIPVPGKV